MRETGSGPPDVTAPEMADVLRQLAIGLSVHRLYDGERVEAATEVAERIAAAVDRALAAGVTDVEVGPDGFADVGGDAGLARLAEACFQRRIQHLRLCSRPSEQDLAALFGALSRDPGEIPDAGGVGALLTVAGVDAILVSEDVPDPSTGEASPEDLLPVDRGEETQDPAVDDALAMRLEPGDDADRLLAKLREVAASLPDDATARSPFYRRANELVAQLPDDERTRFDHAILEAVYTDAFAERYVGHLTDVALAELVLRVSRHNGWDPRNLAASVAVRTGRQGNLPRLVLEKAIGSTGTDDHGPLPTAPVDGEVPPTHPLRAGFPEDAADGRRLALAALVDFLGNAPREEQLEALRDAIAARTREDLLAGDAAAVEELIAAVTRGAGLLGGPEGATLLRAPGKDLDVEAVVGALHLGVQTASRLLRPLGDAAMRPLVGTLEPAQTAATRRTAVEVLRTLGERHLDVVAEAVAGRSAPVQLEAIGVMERIGGQEVLGVLARIAHRSDPALAGRLIDALARLDVPRTPSVLAGVITASRDRGVQRRGLDVLGAATSPAARDLLLQLGSRRSSPLPRRLRRHARKLAGGRR
ncbi:MAG: hypothetical protein WD638_05595 [Nitriliruptoraceae bacterium]